MSQPQHISASPQSPDLPPCPQCGAKMLLIRIDPDSPGVSRHRFACDQCGHDETALVRFR